MHSLKVFSLKGLDTSKGDAKVLSDILRVFAKDEAKRLYGSTIPTFGSEQQTTQTVNKQENMEVLVKMIMDDFLEFCAKIPQALDMNVNKLSPTPPPLHGKASDTASEA